ncbi:MAG TPA: hypothetical protein VMW65_17730, partial [Chloroflexota bacterium]|nr:hypothetical protein [Chloroflexota bacterium]
MIHAKDPDIVEGRSSTRFYRSIRLDQDLATPGALADYTVTPQVQRVLLRAAEALGRESLDRAWTITGPYGTGKSACGLFLAELAAASGHDGNAWSLLRLQAPEVAQELRRSIGPNEKLLPVVATLRRAPLAVGISESLLTAIGRLPLTTDRETLAAELRANLQQPSPDTRRMVRCLRRLIELASASDGYKGVLIILDELGKPLEHAAHHAGEDIYLLQELAEFAQRSTVHPVLVIGILHQSFENYASQVDARTRNEWGKVQGRFADLAFLEPTEQMLRLAGRAAEQIARRAGVNEALVVAVARIAEELTRHSLGPRNLPSAEFRNIAESAVPLHPLTLLALPYLFRRLAQNERSMFGYLSGDEPFGFQDFARNHPDRLIRLPNLYDYCTANVGGLLAGQVVSRRWLEISDAIDRAPDLTQLQVDVLKTVGLLGILG